MTAPDDRPEADAAPGCPHPRHTAALFGQEAAERAFLDAFATGRLPHGWLIAGPRGVGKATLAWRIARFLLATPEAAAEGGLFGAPEPPATLDIAPDHPVARRLAALSESRLMLLRRPWDDKTKRLKQAITVDEVRRLGAFFGMTAADGGRRVVIVDAADEMTPSAANALLKLLEEPPAGAVLLLVSHRPAALLATIRSRCRVLRCAPLGAAAMAAALAPLGIDGAEAATLAALAAGSVGTAAALAGGDGTALYRDLVGLMARAPGLDRPAALALAESVSGRGAEARFDLLATLAETLLARLARSGLGAPPTPEAAPGEAATFARLCPDAAAARHWAGVQQAALARLRAGRAVNLDPAALVLDMVLAFDRAAAAVPQEAR
ncbi:MAG: DNA polymerase III subunit delta' [Rhodobacteraceae bacterium]|nr:DNA polymerase III subunit delta' [Paracoccaceae bacterium]